MLEVKWAGFDYGQCIMEPGGLRNPLVFGDICKILGIPELKDDKVRMYRILKEKYSSYSLIKEGHRDEIYGWVLEGDPEAQELFSQKEQEYLDMGEGLVEALEYLQAQGIQLQVVSEMKKTLGPVGTDIVSRFLKRRGLTKYFRSMVTPQGKIDIVEDKIVDERYIGNTKEAGTLYDILIGDLKDRGIEPHEAVMIGDKPATDINPAHARGMKTIKYTGFMDLGPADNDLEIENFHQLKEILRKKD